MIEQAVILCGGRGRRLGPLTDSVPKPMLPVVTDAGEEPLLAWTVRKLKAISIREVILVVGYRSEAILDFFLGDGSVRSTMQDEPRGTADALEAALPLIKSQFLLTYGDLVIGMEDFAGICQAAAQSGGNWVAVDRRDRPVGAVYFEGDRIRRIVEKPDEPSTCWNTSGLFVLTTETASLARLTTPSARGERELAQLLQIWLDRGGELNPYFLTSRALDIGDPLRYRTVRRLPPSCRGQ